MIVQNKTYPDFIIAGAQKCGSTSLAKWLDSHSDLVCAQPKEPNFFSNRGLAELHRDFSAFFPAVASTKPNALKFEATTSYMTDKVALENIERAMGRDVKIIFILKDPVKRAVSAYYHLFKHLADKRDIEDVFAAPPESPDDLYDYETNMIQKGLDAGTIDITRYRGKYDNFTWAYRYLHNGLFSRHIRNFESVFGKKNVLSLNLDKMKAHPADHFQRITDFLGVRPFDTLPNTSSTHNKTKIPSFLYNKTIRENRALLNSVSFGHDLGCRFLSKEFGMEDSRPLSEEKSSRLAKLFSDEFDFLAGL